MKNISKELVLRGGKAIVFSHVIGTAVMPKYNKLHLHNDFELYVYVSGDVDFIIEDQYLTLTPGTVILARENVLHRPIVKSSQIYERFYIIIPQEIFEDFKQGIRPMDFLKSDISILSMNPEKHRILLELLNRISDAYSNENFQEYYLIYAYILEILKIISDGVQNKTVATLFHQTDMPELVKKVLNYVDGHAGEVCSVKELAQKFYVNASYLSGLFSYATKINLKHYLIMRKIALAKELLMKNDSITDVAYRCGFSSSSHFISVFKKNTGQTPNEYRRSKK